MSSAKDSVSVHDALLAARSDRSLLIAGVGMGISAQAAAGAADIIVAYHSAPLRLRGLPSVAGILPIADANHDTLELLPDIVRGAGETPVAATVFASDPRIDMTQHLELLKSMGAVGVMNAPPVSLLEPALRDDLEAAGLGFDREVELAAAAHARGLLGVMYAFDAKQAAALAEAGSEVIVLHLGITSSGGKENQEWERSLQEVLDVLSEHPDVVFLVHGGPIHSARQVSDIQSRYGRVDGFFGVSSIERLPISKAINEAAQAFIFPRSKPANAGE